MKYRLQEAQASTKNWTLNIRYIFSGQCYSYALYKLHKRSASFCIRHHYDSQNWGKGCHGDICWLPFTSTGNCSSSLSLSCPTHSVLYRLLQKKEKNIHKKMKEKNVASHFCGLFVILVFSRDTWDETETWDWGFLVACVNVRKLNSEDKQEVKCKLNLQHWKMRPTEKSQKRKCISSHGHSIDSLWPHIRGLTKSPHSFFFETQLGQIHQHFSISMVYQSKSTGILQQLLKTGHSSADWNILCIWFVSFFVFLC